MDFGMSMEARFANAVIMHVRLGQYAWRPLHGPRQLVDSDHASQRDDEDA